MRTVHCISLSEIVKNRYLLSRYKEAEINNKNHARIRIWAFACKCHQPPDPHFISKSYFSLFFCGTAPSGLLIVGLVLTHIYKILVKIYKVLVSVPQGHTLTNRAAELNPSFGSFTCAGGLPWWIQGNSKKRQCRQRKTYLFN